MRQSCAERQPYLEAGERELFRLRPEHAARAFRRALSFAPRLPNRSVLRFLENRPIARAMRGLARAYAERGDFQRSRRWLLASIDYPTDWCGVAAMGRIQEVQTTAKVWSSCDTDSQAAASALERFLRKETQITDPPRPARPGDKMNWEFIAAMEASQRDYAAPEARLLLAEVQQKRGNRDAARAGFRALCPDPHDDGDDEITRLARAHLEEHRR